MAVFKANEDKPHRCPRCWQIPDAIWDGSGRAEVGVIYTCPDGHHFRLGRVQRIWMDCHRYRRRLAWWIRDRTAHW